MKKRIVTSIPVVALAVSMTLGALPSAGGAERLRGRFGSADETSRVNANPTTVEAKTAKSKATAKWKLSDSTISVKTNAKKTMKLTGATKAQLKKAKWKIVSGKANVKLAVNAKKNRATITGVQAGMAKVRVTIGKTKKTCSVTVREPSANFTVETTDTAFTMLKQLRAGSAKKAENTLISPDSILTCLTMAGNGASGSTLDEMQKTFGVSDMSAYSLYFADLHDRLTDTYDKTTSYSVANSIWANKNNVTLSNDYMKKNQTELNADLYNLAFDDGTVSKINSWVNEKTNKMIPTIIDSLPDDSAAVLLNAIAFEGKWAEQYEDYQVDENGTFTKTDGTKQTVTMLNGSEDGYSFLTLHNGKGFLKPYRGGDFAFFAYLPPEGTTVDEYLNSIDGQDFIDAYENRARRTVITKMPEFTFDYSTSLKATLQVMGMTESFSDSADFSAMLDLDANPLQSVKISDVIHKTHIELDRNGTKAAAVTAVMMAATSAYDPSVPEEVYLDRPFVFGILDTETGLPLFLGTLNTVER